MNLICKLTDNDIGENYIELDSPQLRLGARGIVIRKDGKIALFNKTNKNEYKLPGGGIECDELPEIAFKREVLEETGCIIDIDKQSDLFYFLIRMQDEVHRFAITSHQNKRSKSLTSSSFLFLPRPFIVSKIELVSDLLLLF